jgi:hypothetical protein
VCETGVHHFNWITGLDRLGSPEPVAVIFYLTDHRDGGNSLYAPRVANRVINDRRGLPDGRSGACQK